MLSAISGADLISIAGAVALAAIGGELFLHSVLGLAAAWRVPKALVATSVAAVATSSPELTVSTVAALAGQPDIGLGDALGSNVVNIALILGLASLFGPLRAARSDFGRDYVLALALPLLTFVFVADGVLSRVEGAMLLTLFALWMSVLVREGRRKYKEETDQPIARLWRLLLSGAGGLAALVVAGRLFVAGAGGIASAFGVDAYVIGATVVAVGTSLPELVTVLLARLRGHDDVGIGTVLGSNLVNGTAIVGIAASIHPISVQLGEVAIALGYGLAALGLLWSSGGWIGRGRGLALLALYTGFVFSLG